MTPIGSKWLQLAWNGSKGLKMAWNGSKSVTAFQPEGQKMPKKGAIKVFFKELKVQKIPPPQKKINKNK